MSEVSVCVCGECVYEYVYQKFINSCVRVYKLLCVCMCRGRGEVSLKEVLFPSVLERECRGYSFSHVVTIGKKSVGYIFKFPPY